MTAPLPVAFQRETLLLRLAREIATDLNDIETILKAHQLTSKQWDAIKDDARFQTLLKSEMEAWSAASNTPERVKLKSAMLVEEWLPEANKLAHDSSQTLTAKVELMKLLKSLAGLGIDRADITASERVSITINLGSDHKLKFEKQLPPKVIDLVPTPPLEQSDVGQAQ